MIKEVTRGVEKAWNDAGDNFKKITPKASGNARNNTRTKRNQIIGDYAYSARLDEGHSRQAPKGMSDPTLDQFEKDIETLIRKQ